MAFRLLNLGLGFPNLTHVQIANSLLDLQGGSAARYFCDPIIGANPAEFLYACGFCLGNEVLDISCPSFCELCPCFLATLVQFAKGNFPFPQVTTFGIVVGLLNRVSTIVFWSSVFCLPVRRNIMSYRYLSCLIVFSII